jgi:hypothetical protein
MVGSALTARSQTARGYVLTPGAKEFDVNYPSSPDLQVS